MEFRRLGGSGFKVPALSMGTVTFGGSNEFFKGWGQSDVAHATRLVDMCLDAGVTMFDSADVYSHGLAEEILGKALGTRRQHAIISTKGTFRMGDGPNDVGSSRYHLIRAVDASLRRLGTDYIDLYQLHGFDQTTPVEEVMGTLDDLVRAGKIRYIGCSNFSGWHLMKSLAVSRQVRIRALRRAPGVLLARRPRLRVGADAARRSISRSARGVEPARMGTTDRQASSRSAEAVETSRLHTPVVVEKGPQVDEAYLYRVVDALDDVVEGNRQDIAAGCAELGAATGRRCRP